MDVFDDRRRRPESKWVMKSSSLDGRLQEEMLK